MGPGSRFMGPGSRFMGPGSRFMRPSRFVARYAGYVVDGRMKRVAVAGELLGERLARDREPSGVGPGTRSGPRKRPSAGRASSQESESVRKSQESESARKRLSPRAAPALACSRCGCTTEQSHTGTGWTGRSARGFGVCREFAGLRLGQFPHPGLPAGTGSAQAPAFARRRASLMPIAGQGAAGDALTQGQTPSRALHAGGG